MPFPDVGLWDGIPAADYHKLDAHSSSRLKDLLDCPAVYRWKKDHPEAQEPSEFTELGTAAHCYLIEPDTFEERYFITKPGFSRSRNTDKAIAEEAERTGKTQIKQYDYDRVREICDAVMLHPFAGDLIRLADGRERSAVWLRDGKRCKARFDFDCVTQCGVIADFKVTSSPHPDDWARHAQSFYQHVQAAWYPSGYVQAAGSGEEPPDWAWIIAPDSPPYRGRIWVAMPTPNWIDYGQREIEKALAIHDKCVSDGNWPGYADELPLEIEPRFLKKKDSIDIRFV